MEERAINKLISSRGKRGVTIWEDSKVAIWEDSEDNRLCNRLQGSTTKPPYLAYVPPYLCMGHPISLIYYAVSATCLVSPFILLQAPFLVYI